MMNYKTSTEKKVIDILRQIEGNKDIGYNIGIFKSPNCDKTQMSISIQIDVDNEDSTKYINYIHDYHEKLVSEDFEHIKLQSDSDCVLLMGYK